MQNCPLTGKPCACDRVFTISEKVREFTYTTDCCRNCAQDYVRLRNESADAEAAQLAAMEEVQAQIEAEAQPPLAISQPTQHQGVLDLLSMMGIDVSLLNKPIVIEKIGKVKATPPADGKRCPGCDCTIHDLRKMKKMGCPHCYETFASELETYLPKVQGGKKSHKGKVPAQGKAPVPDVSLPSNAEDLVKILREQMAQAVTEEDYEKAGKCRDLIKKYGGDETQGAS
jgi:protein-arginine kinase activator protein McsA